MTHASISTPVTTSQRTIHYYCNWTRDTRINNLPLVSISVRTRSDPKETKKHLHKVHFRKTVSDGENILSVCLRWEIFFKRDWDKFGDLSHLSTQTYKPWKVIVLGYTRVTGHSSYFVYLIVKYGALQNDIIGTKFRNNVESSLPLHD